MPTPLERIREVFAPEPGHAPGLFQASATIFSISAVYLYFAGYIYCYFYYYKYFGVTLESLDLSPQFYLMRAYTALNNLKGIGLLLVLMLVIASYLRGWLRTGITVTALIAAFPALFYLSWNTAEYQSRVSVCESSNAIRLHFKESEKKIRASPDQTEAAGGKVVPAASVAGRPSPGKAGPEVPAALNAAKASQTDAPDGDDPVTMKDLAKLGDAGQLGLLLETKERLVVFRKQECDDGKNGPSKIDLVHVYTIERSDIDFTDVSQP